MTVTLAAAHSAWGPSAAGNASRSTAAPRAAARDTATQAGMSWGPVPAPSPITRLSFGPLCRGTPARTTTSSKFQETTHIWDLFQVVSAAGEGIGTLPLQWPQVHGGHLKVMVGTSWSPGPPCRQLERDGAGPVGVGRAQCTKAPCHHMSWPCAAKG